MNWKRLIESEDEKLYRGTLLRFPASHPYESVMYFMIIDPRDGSGHLALLAQTGYKAGILAQRLPKYAHVPGEYSAISTNWLKNNWNEWVYADCDVADVLYSTDNILPET